MGDVAKWRLTVSTKDFIFRHDGTDHLRCIFIVYRKIFQNSKRLPSICIKKLYSIFFFQDTRYIPLEAMHC